MENMYIAIPKAITDLYWNRNTKTSDALGMFCVVPEYQKSKLGKTTISGFKEIISGEIISTRNYYNTEYGTDFFDTDIKVENEEQIGDIEWEIVEKSTADNLLSQEQLEKYMAQSPKDIHDQLETVHRKALMIGQSNKDLNSVSFNRLEKQNMDGNETFIAFPRAIVDIYPNNYAETSKPLGMFCVKPEVKKDILGRGTATGFKEVVTGDKIANRVYFYTLYLDYIKEHLDVDSMANEDQKIGDIVWDIVEKSTVERLLTPAELKAYMAQSPEEIRAKLQDIHMQAEMMAKETNNLDVSKKAL